MDDMEQKLGAILNNPQMMQQIMSMAQSLGAPPQKQDGPAHPQPPQMAPSVSGGIDSAAIQRIIQVARQSGIDKNQQDLLRALSPYLSKERIHKLEKAMRAAKIAGIATTALRSSQITSYSGR